MDDSKNNEKLLIEGIFEDLEKKASFLKELIKNNHSDEALLLCCCYIDGLANNLYGGNRSNINFIRALQDFGEDDYWGLIHPDQLIRNILRKVKRDPNDKKLSSTIEKVVQISSIFEWKLYSEEEIIETIRSHIELTSDEADRIRKNLWRGKFANIVYEKMRSPFVHNLGEGGSPSFFFSKTIHKGEPLPSINFHALYQIMNRILDHAKKLSLETGILWGREEKEGDDWSFVRPA